MPTYKSPDAVDDDLHRLLLTAVPENEHGNKTILYLSVLLGINRWSITKWIRNQKIAPERVLQIVELSRIERYQDGKPVYTKGKVARVKREDFDRFVYKP